MQTRRRFLQALMAISAAGAAGAVPPVFARGAAPGLTVSPIAPGVWLHTSWKLLPGGTPFPSNGLIVSGSRRALIIDTTWPTGDMEPLLRRARQLTGGRKLRLVVTHAHDDRMSGVGIARRAGVPSLAHALTREDARARGLPLTDEIWEGTRRRIPLGGPTVHLFRPGPAHTRDNVVVFIEGPGVLFGGCMIRTRSTRSLGNTADAEIAAWAGSVDAVIAEFGDRIRLVVPGHGEPGGPELLTHTKSLAEAAAG